MRRDDRASDDPRAIGAQKTLSLSSSFLTSSTSDAWLACATRAVTGTSACAWQSRIRFSPRGKEEIADFRYHAGRALSGAHGRFKAPDSHARTHPALLVSTVLRSPSLSRPLFLLRLLSASQPGREERMRGSRSFIPRGGVQRRLSRCAIGRERAHASERAGGRARTSALP